MGCISFYFTCFAYIIYSINSNINLKLIKNYFYGGIKMKCPYCDKEMENGEVKVVDTMFNMVSNLGWYPENEIKKMVKKNYVNLKFKGAGYY